MKKKIIIIVVSLGLLSIIGFLGFTGGKLIDLCDVKIHVQSEPGEYGPVEDAHLIMNHILAHWFQNKLK